MPVRSNRPISRAGACTAIAILFGIVAPALAAAPGDIAIIAYQSSDPDALAFVALAPLAAGETLRFTDSGWQLPGSFRASEGGVQYTVPAGGLAAGTVVSRPAPFTSGDWSVLAGGFGVGSAFGLSTAGDQILAFQGMSGSPSFVSALNYNSPGWSDATTSNTSALPPGLTDGVTAVNLGSLSTRTNGYYNGITSGTAAQLRAAIGTPANWVMSTTSQTWPTWSFNVGGGPGPLPPTAFAGDDRTVLLNNGQATFLMTDAMASDPNGLTGLTYGWTPETGPGIGAWAGRTGNVVDITSPSDAQITLTVAGMYTFTLTVTDPDMQTATDMVVITVSNAPPVGQYDEPPTYYNPARPGGAWLTGASLKTALNSIITGHRVRSYDAAKQALQLLDLDPNNSANVLLIYTGASVPKPWDAGVTWNREHQWPQSLIPAGSDLETDLFNLRACDPIINSTRGNSPYGLGAVYWDPNHGAMDDRGTCARALFYCATRYTNVSLVNGQPTGVGTMGDLSRLLAWHFEHPVSTFERRRNHFVYSLQNNPTYYQGNRNPFIDHPELVWSIFAASGNNAEIYLGANPPANGASSANVNLGRIIKNAQVPAAQSVIVAKAGASPTTYDILVSGGAVSSAAGQRQTFLGGAQQRMIDVGLSTLTNTAGQLSGTITVDNTDVSSAGPGTGSADGDDVISVTLDVLEPSNASFTTPADQNALTINFGSVAVGSGTLTQSFTVRNLVTMGGFTAALDLDTIGGTGNTATLTTNLAPFGGLAAGGSNSFSASFNTSAVGSFSATYTLNVSDENIPGASAGTALSLTLTGTVTPPPCLTADVNCDNAVNMLDVAPFVNLLIFGGTPCRTCTADMNNDGQIDGADIQAFVAAVVH